jgi:hypothetical protein
LNSVRDAIPCPPGRGQILELSASLDYFDCAEGCGAAAHTVGERSHRVVVMALDRGPKGDQAGSRVLDKQIDQVRQ